MRIVALLLLIAILVVLSIIGKNRPPPSPSDTPVQVAQGVYQRVCQQCHGAAGEGNLELKTPSIAGQPEWYLRTQLEKFRLGQRGTEPRDTLGQQMRTIAVSLNEPDMAEAIETVAAFPIQATKPSLEGDLASGQLIYEEQCIECHRYNGSGERVFGSSPLTTFQDWYLAAQIEKFRTGVRGYHPQDEKGRQMRHLLGYLDEGDAVDLSAYIASLAQRYPPKKRSRRVR